MPALAFCISLLCCQGTHLRRTRSENAVTEATLAIGFVVALVGASTAAHVQLLENQALVSCLIRQANRSVGRGAILRVHAAVAKLEAIFLKNFLEIFSCNATRGRVVGQLVQTNPPPLPNLNDPTAQVGNAMFHIVDNFRPIDPYGTFVH